MRIAHYLNQFFGGIGAEDKADVPLEIRDGAVGPGIALNNALRDRGTVANTLICGDNFFADHQETVIQDILKVLDANRPDLFVAGPAFNAGRYGLACGALCQAIGKELNIPTITGLYPDNPAVTLYRKDTIIVPTGDSATGMAQAISDIARMGVKLGRDEPLGSAAEEGYLPRGYRRNLFLAKSGAERAVDMLLAKLDGQPFVTELKIEQFEMVPPAPPLEDLSQARIAIVTESGVVPMGNPDRLEWARGSKWLKYSLAGLDDLTSETHQAIHGGFDNTWTNEDPDRMLGVDVLRQLETEGFIGSLFDYYYVTMGNGGDLGHMQRFGAEIARELEELGINGVISPAT